MRFSWSVGWVVLVLAVVAIVPAHAASKIVLPRPGQVGIGVQGGYGTLLEGGDLGDLFSDGASLNIRLRYRMRFERAIGISFESQTFDARVQGTVADTVAKTLTLIMTGFDIYQMFDTREKTTKMLSVGIGIARPSVELTSEETTYPEDGFYVTAGGGIEHFFWRSWAWDLSVRYHAIFQRGKVNNDFQAALGVILYAAQ
jgi:hypothetical protein